MDAFKYYRKAQKFGKQTEQNLQSAELRSEALVFYTGVCAKRPLVVSLKPSTVNLRTTFKVVFVGFCCCFGLLLLFVLTARVSVHHFYARCL